MANALVEEPLVAVVDGEDSIKYACAVVLSNPNSPEEEACLPASKPAERTATTESPPTLIVESLSTSQWSARLYKGVGRSKLCSPVNTFNKTRSLSSSSSVAMPMKRGRSTLPHIVCWVSGL